MTDAATLTACLTKLDAALRRLTVNTFKAAVQEQPPPDALVHTARALAALLCDPNPISGPATAENFLLNASLRSRLSKVTLDSFDDRNRYAIFLIITL